MGRRASWEERRRGKKKLSGEKSTNRKEEEQRVRKMRKERSVNGEIGESALKKEENLGRRSYEDRYRGDGKEMRQWSWRKWREDEKRGQKMSNHRED